MAIKAKTFCIVNKTFEIEEDAPWIIIKENSIENFEKFEKIKLLDNMEKFIASCKSRKYQNFYHKTFI